MIRGRPPGKETKFRVKTTPMDRFWKEWGEVVRLLGAKGFQDFCKKYGGMLIPTYGELLDIGKSEVVRQMIDAGATVTQIKAVAKLGAGKINEILKEIEEEGERERREQEPGEYGDGE